MTEPEKFRNFGVEEDRTREQFTAEVLRHPPGKPGHVYVASVIARFRANSLSGLAEMVEGYDPEANIVVRRVRKGES